MRTIKSAEDLEKSHGLTVKQHFVRNAITFFAESSYCGIGAHITALVPFTPRARIYSKIQHIYTNFDSTISMTRLVIDVHSRVGSYSQCYDSTSDHKRCNAMRIDRACCSHEENVIVLVLIE